jgi:hypothetical protein
MAWHDSVLAATQAWLERLPDELRLGPEAASLIVLSGRIDNPRSAAMAMASMNREHREAVAAIRAQAPPDVVDDPVDELERARSERRQRASEGA